MKKVLFVLGLLLLILTINPEKVFADSPLTSTSFSDAYMDNDLVKQADELRVINLEMAEYLADENNPIDVKAAIINALSWEDPGKKNTEKYCEYIYKDSLDNIDVSSLSGDQEFCIGYLIAMDDYTDIKPEALKYLTEAEEKLTSSFTVSIIRVIVETMNYVVNAWEVEVEPILVDDTIQMDMRPDAVNIILDYMSLYHESKGVIVSDNDLSIKNGGTTRVYLFGAWWTIYSIVEDSDLVNTVISQDQYGINYIDLTGIREGSSYIKIKNENDESVIITFAVNSEGTDFTASTPQTGEKPMLLLWTLGVAITALGMVVFNIRKRVFQSIN